MNCKIEGCQRPVENEETGLCATHGLEMRKLERKGNQPKKFYTIPKVSAKKKERNKKIKETYNLMDAITPHFCSGCGAPLDPNGSHSHLSPRSQYPEFEACAWNLVYDCIRCHEIWEHGSWDDVQVLFNIDERLKILLQHNQQYLYRRFILKNPKITLILQEKFQ